MRPESTVARASRHPAQATAVINRKQQRLNLFIEISGSVEICVAALTRLYSHSTSMATRSPMNCWMFDSFEAEFVTVKP